MHYLLLIYVSNKPVPVSSRLVAHHQENQQPVNPTHDYTNCCLYRVDSPDDEQQAKSKHVEDYYWKK
jgi:hypothetical protein